MENVHQSQPPISQNEQCIMNNRMVNAGEYSIYWRCLVNTVTSSEHLLLSLFWSMCKSDVVFDCYLPNSIKGGTRSKGKEGKSRRHYKECEEWEQRIGDWLNTSDFKIKTVIFPWNEDFKLCFMLLRLQIYKM